MIMLTVEQENKFLKLWIKKGIDLGFIESGKVNGIFYEIHPHFVAYDANGKVSIEEWPDKSK